jgi:hypothetical protein
MLLPCDEYPISRRHMKTEIVRKSPKQRHYAEDIKSFFTNVRQLPLCFRFDFFATKIFLALVE